MGKKVLILSSSPRKKGNSNALCDRSWKAQWKAATKLKGGLCGQENQLLHRLFCLPEKWAMAHRRTTWRRSLAAWAAADVIVMATPVYFYTMCAQMKTVMTAPLRDIRRSPTRISISS